MEVIERCTNMWWNPINHFKRKEQQRMQAAEREEQERIERKRRLQEEKKEAVLEAKAKQQAKKRKQSSTEADPTYDGEAWTFSCICGEKCSHYENPRYHPKGPQFECDQCHIWSHVKCVLKKLPADENAVCLLLCGHALYCVIDHSFFMFSHCIAARVRPQYGANSDTRLSGCPWRQ